MGSMTAAHPGQPPARRRLALGAGALALAALLLGSGLRPAQAKLWDGGERKCELTIPDDPAPWEWLPHDSAWAKYDIQVGAERRLKELRDGSPAHGQGGSFGEILNQSFGNRGEPDVQPSRDQDAAAALMLKAMIQAAKSDGRIDAAEERKLLGNLGDVSPAERRFVETELRGPIDVQGLARQVPRGLEQQFYTMSVMAIDLDNRNEAEYLNRFASALGLDRGQVNRIHARLGVPALYS